jgi:hypothetical protein
MTDIDNDIRTRMCEIAESLLPKYMKELAGISPAFYSLLFSFFSKPPFLAEPLSTRSLDKEESVRKAVIATLTSVMLRSPSAVTPQFGTCIGKRVLDKKVATCLFAAAFIRSNLSFFFFRKAFGNRHVKV